MMNPPYFVLETASRFLVDSITESFEKCNRFLSKILAHQRQK